MVEVPVRPTMRKVTTVSVQWTATTKLVKIKTVRQNIVDFALSWVQAFGEATQVAVTAPPAATPLQNWMAGRGVAPAVHGGGTGSWRVRRSWPGRTGSECGVLALPPVRSVDRGFPARVA